MRTIKYKWHSSNGRIGSDQEDQGEIEVEDNATEKEIDDALTEIIREEVMNYFEWGFEIIE